MAAVNIHNNFGAQENKICHCFHFFPICHEVWIDQKLIFHLFTIILEPKKIKSLSFHFFPICHEVWIDQKLIFHLFIDFFVACNFQLLQEK